MKICHISDIHFRALQRHGEYRAVFDTLTCEISSKSVDCLFVGGDIWHTKTQGISPEFIDVFSETFTALSELVPIHMILGNHDGLIGNESRQDAISPLVDALDNPRIKLYKKSGVYELSKGINLCVFSLFDEPGWSDVRPVRGEYNIACYHGSVRGARLESDWELTDGVNIDFFADYDLALLGDIHKTQFLGYRNYSRGERPWIGYPGSLLQQNYAEDMTHGYYLWEVETDTREHDVTFCALPNPNPYVTVDWGGSVTKTLLGASRFPTGSRFRVKSDVPLSQSDINSLVSGLKRDRNALEVVFKIDHVVDRDVISTGQVSVARNDLRNLDVILEMLKSYYAGECITIEQWSKISSLVETYMHGVVHKDDCARNTKWTLKRLEFDNMYAYGEGNIIDFSKLSGVTGILGPNRIGKSSIVGTILYCLFNDSDRGSLKNLHLINTKKGHCLAKATVNVNGTDYLLERQTVKHENKKGPHGVTSLNVFRLNHDGTRDDMNGEMRVDTDKVIKNLIGTSDDFQITTVSAQDDLKKFVKEGATPRKQVISRFLDLDVFDRVYDLANKDVNSVKASLKNISVRDWNSEIENNERELTNLDSEIDELASEINASRNRLVEIDNKIADFGRKNVVSESELESKRSDVRSLERKLDDAKNKVERGESTLNELEKKLEKLEYAQSLFDLDELRGRYDNLRELESSLLKLKHQLQTEQNTLSSQQRSVLKLLDVPCGDFFPNCKFIKDSHRDKSLVGDQEAKVKSLLAGVEEMSKSVEALRSENIVEKIRKCETVNSSHNAVRHEISKCQAEIARLNAEISVIETNLDAKRKRLDNLTSEFDESLSDELNRLTGVRRNLSAEIEAYERKKNTSIRSKGRLEGDIERLGSDRKKYQELCDELKIHELVANAFSKRGIPNKVIHNQLPFINSEIGKILAGIVNFTLELEADTESNALDIFINYGDSRRIIELGSGMEKVIASIAIRAALTLVTTLPKTDMFVIDEGFSDLDESSVELCNRLIQSLKKYFRSILIITHIDGIKETVDNLIEITRNEHESKVVHA